MAEEKTCQCGSQCEEESIKDESEIKLQKTVSDIKRKILVLSGKGGVGKSTVSANIAVGLAQKGYQVGLLDVDIHGPNIPNMLGLQGLIPLITDIGLFPIKAYENLQVISIGFFLEGKDTPVIWRGPLKHNMIKQFLTEVRWGKLDYLVVDSPPGTGDEVISVVQLLNKVDGAVIVATPQEVALADVRRSIRFCLEASVPVLGIVENMSGFVCPRCGDVIEIFKTGGAEKLAQEYNVPFLGKIPLDPRVVQGGDEGKPVLLYYPDSEPAKAFAKVVDQIAEALKI
ncbi:Mrp/NBP35 family ATP-binding protein [Thermodesulfobacterium sp. TA1]|uniref:Mrp/NBP35 family ATP-binding protein n=1 Tax=Thermodesulfobacterium sp. TA1 TaxID=2234087 RepID=UPI001231FC55|nr:Mrp/NBP35 family ATP-binding protein [Thermodesulfobacterium sp. TA1]QER41642.1 Mrp/NBP35 family ATP-binding protein [Thermodesulfobacterium sp. TA1]